MASFAIDDVVACYGRCPEPELWCVEWKLKQPMRLFGDVWIRGRDLDLEFIKTPYEDAIVTGRRLAASSDVARVRLVRARTVPP